MKKSDNFPYAFFRGKIVPVEEAKVSIMTNALQYGNAVFGGIRGYVGKDKKIYIFRINDHYKRFLSSLSILNRSIKYSQEQLVEISKELVKRNSPKTDCYLRPFAYGAKLGISPNLHGLDFDFSIYMIPLGEYLPLTRGLRLMISSWIRVNDSMIPARAKISGSYVNSSLAKGDASRLGFDDALMMDRDGHITEGSAANFFIVRDGTLITPSPNCDILEGITRRSIIALAKDLSIPVLEREIDRSEVFIADEAFLCGTGVQVAWVGEVDGRVIGNGTIGPITRKLQKLYFDIVHGEETKYSDWLTKI